jgi:hypothetical protein
VLGRQALDGRHDESGGGVVLDAAAADDVELDPAAGEPPDVVERPGQVPGEAVQVVDDDRQAPVAFTRSASRSSRSRRGSLAPSQNPTASYRRSARPD